MKENIIPKIFNIDISKFLSINKLCIPYKLTTANVGIEIKKEILVESILLKFKNLAAVIVIPDLLTPGIKDKT